MSMFPFPSKLMPDVRTMEEMGEEMMAMLPRQMRPAANLMAYPAGAAAAMSAIGLGAIGQVFGIMFGSLSGAVDAGHRMGLAGPFMDPSVFDWPSPFTARRPEEAASVEVPGPEASARVERALSAGKAAPKRIARNATDAAVAVPSATEIMPEDFHRPSAIEMPAKPDDLKMIGGIGPKLEQVLNSLGVWTFAQIAAWSDAEIAWVDDSLALRGRVTRDEWLGQADALARGGREEYVKVFGREPK